jgi:PAS domain S-box-containing protein
MELSMASDEDKDDRLEGRRRADVARAYLAAIVESSDDAIISKDLNGIIESANPAAERMFGYAQSELVGRPVRLLIPPERQGEEDDILARIRRGERVDHFETVRVTKDGRLLDVSLTISPVRDASGALIGVSKVARDITERRRAAAALAGQQEWFRVTLASIGDAVIACDQHGRVQFLNGTAERLTGWQTTAAGGKPLDEVFRILNEETRERVESPVTRVLAEGQIVGLANHTVLVAADGTERAIDDSGAPIRDANGRILGVVVVFRDVTDARLAARERERVLAERDRLLEAERNARTEAERANKVKDDFVAMVSHELRTPLNAILGWTDMMRRTPADEEIVARGLDVVARNTRLQAQLISDLLDISRIVSGKLRLDMQQTDLATVVNDAIESVQPSAEAKGIELRTAFDPGIGAVAADPARVEQVVWNLLTNAIRFTPRGGRVEVALQAAEGGIDLVVADTGSGITPEFLPHVFDRFQQADAPMTRRVGGLGLGLSIVKHLVELHGGRVEVRSEGEGKGSTFVVRLPAGLERLPVPDSPPPPAIDRSEPAEAVSLEGFRVLIVEDEPDARDFLARLLAAHGAEVLTATSAIEALGIFRSADVDMIVSDIGLPEMDGYQLMQRIRELETPEGGAVPALALTAFARTEDRTRALRAGFQAHLAKPVDPPELVATVASFAELVTSQRRP